MANAIAVFSIVTACLGGISVFEYFYRLYNLFRKNSRARPLNARKSWVGLSSQITEQIKYAYILIYITRKDQGTSLIVRIARLLSYQLYNRLADLGGGAYCVCFDRIVPTYPPRSSSIQLTK